MIIFELQCAHNHRFEGWFASGEDFEAQRKGGILSCPTCGNGDVKKLLTAKIGKETARDTTVAAAERTTSDMQVAALTPQAVMAFVAQVLSQTEDVGKQFVDEARRIHRQEAPSRAIRGQATPEEAQDLLEEGIFVVPLPVPPREEWH